MAEKEGSAYDTYIQMPLTETLDRNQINMETQVLSRTEADTILEQFSRIPAVSALYLDREGSVLCVTIVVSAFRDEVLDRVFDAEQLVMRDFPHGQFNFNVLFQNGRPLDELIAPAIPFYQRA